MENPESPSPVPAQPASSPASEALAGFAGPALKIVLIAALFLLMLLPLSFVSTLIVERQERQSEVLREFRGSWGPEQSVLGPILVVPYRAAVDDRPNYLHITPIRLAATAHLVPETRRRGLFRAVVYTAQVNLKGTFQIPDAAILKNFAGDLAWKDSFVVLRATDLRAVSSTAQLNWNGRPLPWTDCAESGNTGCERDLFVVARVGLSVAPSPNASIPFETNIDLRGTQAFWVAPLGKEVDVRVDAPWSTPSFIGATLPASTSVGEGHFDASWHVASNVATTRWLWSSAWIVDTDATLRGRSEPEYRVGVELLEPVPTYRMVERSAKYASLFLALSFLTYFLFEAISGTRIHVIQYGLLGLSISLFALLLISFSEPLGFAAGYAVSSVLVLLQASIYTATVTRQRRQAVAFAGVLAALFGFLYVVLSLETYSLLVGSVALFAALSIAMAAMRHVDWSHGQWGRPKPLSTH
jgi:inner membrane protein